MNEELKAVRDLIQAFLKSKKLLRMYPSNNPIYVKTLEDSFSRFINVFYYKDQINLNIRQNEIYYDSEQIYHNPEKEDNLALFFLKDGLRELSFDKGMTSEEMEEFLKIISLDFDRDVVDDDIVTLFWEKDFQHIHYVVDETFLADEEDYETKAVEEIREKSQAEDNLQRAYEDAFRDSEAVKEPAIISVSEKDLQLLSEDLEKDSEDKVEKLFVIVFSMFFMAESQQDYADVVEFMRNALEYSVRQADIQTVTKVLKKLKRIVDDESFSEEMKNHARSIMLFAGSNKIITVLGEILDSGKEIDEKIFNDYLKFLGKNAITPFVKILGELESIHSRKVVIDALVFIGPQDIVTLAKGLKDSRWYVVRNIIYILRKIGDKRAVEYLLKTVRHGDIRVKKEVIRTLGELGGSNVVVALRDYLADPDGQVRSASLKALGSVGSEAAKRIIMDKISDNTFKDRSFEEKKEYFETLSRWNDKEVYDFLIRTIKKGAFWGRSKNYEKRACAAYSLGLIGDRNALPLLNKYKSAGSKILREYSYSAIKRIEHGK